MNTLENYLVTLKIGAWAAIAGLAVSLVCLLLLAIVVADLAAVKKALRLGPPARHAVPPYPPAPVPPPYQPR